MKKVVSGKGEKRDDSGFYRLSGGGPTQTGESVKVLGESHGGQVGTHHLIRRSVLMIFRRKGENYFFPRRKEIVFRRNPTVGSLYAPRAIPGENRGAFGQTWEGSIKKGQIGVLSGTGERSLQQRPRKSGLPGKGV